MRRDIDGQAILITNSRFQVSAQPTLQQNCNNMANANAMR